MTGTQSRTTRIEVGVVDVIVLARQHMTAPLPRRSPWRVLTLRRAQGTRCTGAWELVHGRIESRERPADAARREVLEETGLVVTHLYSLAVNPFYLHHVDTVEMAVGFAAVVDAPSAVRLGVEHDQALWRTPAAAMKALTWPREHDLVRDAMHLLRSGDAGAANDVLRVE